MNWVVDAHVHIFPPEIVRNRQAFCDRDRWFGHLYRNERARLATAEDLLTSMEEAGVHVSIAAGFPWADPGLCGYHNDYLADAAARSGGRIAWFRGGKSDSRLHHFRHVAPFASGC